MRRGESTCVRTFAPGGCGSSSDGLIEIPVDGDIAIRANELTGLHADPADRLIIATALGGHTLVTADARLLSWSGRLTRMDARK